MSIIAREWALRQDLAPVHKLVLVVLGDAADDQGRCWPRISTVAKKVGVSPRTIQRSVQYLVQHKLVTVEPRQRSDGSSSSNKYRLKLKGGDNLSSPPDKLTPPPDKLTPPPDKLTPPPDKLTPPPDTPVTQGCQPCQGEGDTGVTPLTERRTEREPPPRESVPTIKTRIEDRGGGKRIDLHYPKELVASERNRAEVMIGALDPPLDQQVLDEWAAIIAARDIRASPLGCLRALIERAREGNFTPERGHRIAQARLAQRRVKAQAAKLPELAPVDESNPLVRRMQQVVQRQGKG